MAEYAGRDGFRPLRNLPGGRPATKSPSTQPRPCLRPDEVGVPGSKRPVLPDDLALLCAGRIVEVLGADAADIRTGAAGDARAVGRLIIRGLAQSRTPSERAALRDVLHQLSTM
jgi:hypothetical protein